jgi:hypothetical protein
MANNKIMTRAADAYLVAQLRHAINGITAAMESADNALLLEIASDHATDIMAEVCRELEK